MKPTSEQKSWYISIVMHVMIISLASFSVVSKVAQEEKIRVPIEITIIEKKAPPKKAVKTKKVATKKAKPQAKKVKKVTSLPGDRPSPAISKQRVPVYPKKAQNNEWEGRVKLKVTISDTGKVLSITVISSSGHPVLDQSFIRTVKQQYQFQPKRKMGKNIAGDIILSHTFSIEQSS